MRHVLTIIALCFATMASAATYGSPSPWGSGTTIVDGTATQYDTYFIAAPSGSVPWFPMYTGATSPNAISACTIGTGLQYNSGVLSCTVTAPSKTVYDVTPTIGAATQLSTTVDTQVTYPVDVSTATALLATAQGTVTLLFADDAAFTTGVRTVMSGTQGIGGLTVPTNIGTVTLTGVIPAGKYRKITTANTQGSPSFAARQGQEYR